MNVLKKCVYSVAISLLGFVGCMPAAVFAAPNSISATGPSTVSSDAQSITITIQSDLGSTQIPVVDAYVTYDSTKLDYTGINYAGSPFAADTPDAVSGSNYIKISRYAVTQPYPSGAALIAKMTFKPKVGSGTTQIGFDKPQSGFFTEQGDDVLASTVSLAIQFTTPVSSPPVSTTQSPAAPSGSTAVTPPKPSSGTNNGSAPVTAPNSTTTSQTPETKTDSAVATATGFPAAQPLGTVTNEQKKYTGGTSSVVSFFAKTPVRIGLMTAIPVSVLILAYAASTGYRQRRYVRAASSQAAIIPVQNPTAHGIMVGYDPTVINPQAPQQPNDIER